MNADAADYLSVFLNNILYRGEWQERAGGGQLSYFADEFLTIADGACAKLNFCCICSGMKPDEH
jgi:hypothetical protein